jgi:hypothetical protein
MTRQTWRPCSKTAQAPRPSQQSSSLLVSILDKSGGGNHLIQPTATSRPTLSSRYNLLTKTEQFDDAYWTGNVGGGGSVPVRVANDAVAPDGTTTADKLTFGAATTADLSLLNGVVSSLVTGGSYVVKAFVKAATPGDVGKSIVYRSVGADNYSTLTLTTDYQQISLTSVAAAPSGDGLSIGLRPVVGGSTGTVSVHIWGASLTTAADASLPYQRVNTATDYDYDFSKFPAYLKFDGVDDSLYSAASIDFTSTDKMTVFAGVHKASDATGCLLELSATASANTRTFNIFSSASAVGKLRWLSYGTVLQTASDVTVNAPATRVISAIGDISGDRAVIRGNGVQTGSSAADQGTGNYGNYPLYIGSRNNAIFPFNRPHLPTGYQRQSPVSRRDQHGRVVYQLPHEGVCLTWNSSTNT